MKVIYKHRSSRNSTTVWSLSTQANVKTELRHIFRTHFDEKLLTHPTFNHLAPVSQGFTSNAGALAAANSFAPNKAQY